MVVWWEPLHVIDFLDLSPKYGGGNINFKALQWTVFRGQPQWVVNLMYFPPKCGDSRSHTRQNSQNRELHS